jgi:hypothetical protein
MAMLMIGVSTCSRCGVILQADDDICSFPRFGRDPRHPLWRYADESMHQHCWDSWDEAATFQQMFNAENMPHRTPHPRVMLSDGSIVPLKKTKDC